MALKGGETLSPWKFFAKHNQIYLGPSDLHVLKVQYAEEDINEAKL